VRWNNDRPERLRNRRQGDCIGDNRRTIDAQIAQLGGISILGNAFSARPRSSDRDSHSSLVGGISPPKPCHLHPRHLQNVSVQFSKKKAIEPLSGNHLRRFDRRRAITADSVKTYGNPTRRSACRNTDEFLCLPRPHYRSFPNEPIGFKGIISRESSGRECDQPTVFLGGASVCVFASLSSLRRNRQGIRPDRHSRRAATSPRTAPDDLTPPNPFRLQRRSSKLMGASISALLGASALSECIPPATISRGCTAAKPP